MISSGLAHLGIWEDGHIYIYIYIYIHIPISIFTYNSGQDDGICPNVVQSGNTLMTPSIDPVRSICALPVPDDGRVFFLAHTYSWFRGTRFLEFGVVLQCGHPYNLPRCVLWGGGVDTGPCPIDVSWLRLKDLQCSA